MCRVVRSDTSDRTAPGSSHTARDIPAARHGNPQPVRTVTEGMKARPNRIKTGYSQH
jgi:hypothetical protein